MSQETIDIMRQQRKDQVELNPSSELFQIVDGGTFRGVFDRAHLEDRKDKGNVTQKKLTPLIMVSEIPSGLIERTTQIERESVGKTYTLSFVSLDDEGIPILWLY